MQRYVPENLPDCISQFKQVYFLNYSWSFLNYSYFCTGPETLTGHERDTAGDHPDHERGPFSSSSTTQRAFRLSIHCHPEYEINLVMNTGDRASWAIPPRISARWTW